MASCPKCGKRKIKKRKGYPRRCKRCGVLPGIEQFDRAGKHKEIKDVK